MSEETSAMKATLDGLVREQAERRVLRDQKTDEIKASSQEVMTKQVMTAQRYVEKRRELGERKTKSGWSTDRSQAQPGTASAFDDAPAFEDTPAFDAPPARAGRDTPRRAPRRPAPVDDEDDAFLNNRWRE